MIGRRVLCLFLMLSAISMGLLANPPANAGAAPAPVRVAVTANQTAECAQLAFYAGTLEGVGQSIDDEESGVDTDHMETWTEADYDAAIVVYDSILAQWDSITPPQAAVEFHQTIRDGIALFQVAMETMKTAGPFAILAYLDQFDQLNKRAADLALPLEEQCGIALYESDDDGELEVGPGVATPVPDEEIPAAEATPVQGEDISATDVVPVAMGPGGRPIMPIGTSVQTSDAFSLTIVSVDQNAVDAVPETPPAGYQYVNVEITLGHLRDQTDTFDLINLVAVGAGGASYSAVGNSCGPVDGPLAPGDYTGTLNMTGHVCFVVASRDVAGLALYDQTQPPDELVFLSLDPSAGS